MTHKFRCLVVDDEELARGLIESHLAQLDRFELVGSCSSAIEASTMLQANNVDLMFLDIEMPVLKGTDFYKNLLHKPKVIFTTAYRDYAVDGFELDAVDYLLKPIVFARFFQAIERFLATQNNKPTIAPQASRPLATRHIFVRKDRKQIKLQLDEIVYVQGLKDYVQVFLEDGSHIVKQTLGNFDQQLGSGFVRTHRSYIVNLHKITAITNQDVELGDLEVPIGANYRAALLASIGQS